MRLIATDIRGLADTALTTATIISPAAAIQDATTEVDALVASGMLAGGDGKWLRNKLDLAITLLSRDSRIAAVNQLQESVRSLSGDDVAALRTHLLLIIQSVSARE